MDLDVLKDTLIINLSTIGRKSGQWSRIEIWWFYIEGRFVITGTPGPRDWYANVLANPAIRIHAGDAEWSGTALPITDEAARRRVLTDSATSWYSTQSELDALIAGSPMIELRLEDLSEAGNQ